MAEEKPKKKKSLVKRLLKVFLFLLLLLVLIVGGFALGIYLQIFDSKEANEKLGLYRLPVVGQYFVKPADLAEEDMENTPLDDVRPQTENKSPAEDKSKDTAKEQPKQSKPVRLTKEEIEKQMQEREAAEKKRVSKLARLYDQMKPQEAASAMESMDDDLVVSILQRMDEGQAAKVLGKLNPSRAAGITQIMFEGRQQRMTLPGENRRQSQEQENEEIAVQ